MTDDEQKAWEEFVEFTKYLIKARNYEQPSERAILAAAAELKRLREAVAYGLKVLNGLCATDQAAELRRRAKEG